MADTVSIDNFPDSGSKEAVAMRLTTTIMNFSGGEYRTKDQILNLYAECLEAAYRCRD